MQSEVLRVGDRKYRAVGRHLNLTIRPEAAPSAPKRTASVARTYHKVAEGFHTMMTNEVGKLLTASEVAEMLHLHVNTVKRLGDRGELPFFRVTRRGDRRFRYDDVLEFLRRDK